MEAIKHMINITKRSTSRIGEVDFSNIPFGRHFSDHMLIADYNEGVWSAPSIVPYDDISFAPSLAALHYAQSIFEGMKAFRSGDRAFLFRPEKNYARMNHSADRMSMPSIPHDIFIEGIKELVRLDKNWIPSSEGSALYLRPFLFATDEYVGIRTSGSYKFVIVTCPVGAYYSEPVKLLVIRDLVRAFPGGTGDVKAAGNYAASLYGTRKAVEAGYHNVLWLDGMERRYVEECGTMNIAFVIDGVVVTPSLTGTILEGVTRDSVITLLKEMNSPVEERRISIDELVEAHKAGKFQEAFGMGTAATVAHVAKINVDGFDMNLPPIADRKIGPAVLKRLNDIRYARTQDPYNWMVEL